MRNYSGNITVEKKDEVTVVRFEADVILDELQIQELGHKLMQLVKEGNHRIVVSFTRLRFMSSAFLGKLITLQREIQSNGGRQVLCEIRPDIYETFAITKLNEYFTIAETEELALTQVSRP